MQQHMLAQISNALTLAGLQPCVAQQWANTGTVYGYAGTTQTPAVAIAYDYQHGNYTLSLRVLGVPVNSQPGRYGYYDFYQPYTQPTRFWFCLYTALLQRGVCNANAQQRKQLRALLKGQQQYAMYNNANQRW